MKERSQLRLAETAARPAPERRSREQDADRRAIHAFDVRAEQTSINAPRRPLPGQLSHGSPFPGSGGQAVAPALRAPFEQAFGHDFSQVRIFPDGEAASLVRAAGSRAITCGPRIALAPGQWAPETATGRALLAHELGHVSQQASEGFARLDHKTLDEEIDEELKTRAAGDPKSIDPNNEEYARSLQGYGKTLGRNDQGQLEQEPKDPKAKEIWKRKFQKVEKLAGRILDQSGPKVEQKDQRAEMLAVDLANVGLVNEAMAIAPKISDVDVRKFIYLAVLDQPAKVSDSQLASIAQEQVAAAAKCADHTLFKRLFSDDGAYAKQLGATKVNAALKVIVKAYASDADLPDKLANIVYFLPASRADFTEWMIADKRGALLRQVSEQAYFDEGTVSAATGNAQAPTAADQGWAIGNRQRVTVDDVIELCASAKITVAAPAARDINTLKAWLEANTENIGKALATKYPGDADKAKAMYTRIAETFTWHVPSDTKEDVIPDKSGHITALTAAGPQSKQLKVDCDVLATYAVRLLVAAGFTPIGYMAIKPTKKDEKRLAHAMALLKQGNNFHAVSNSATDDLGAISKTAALQALRDFGIGEAYDAKQPLTNYDVFYMDSDAKGTLPTEVLNQDSKIRDGSLSQ
jgi:hypothetical protein